MCWLVVIAWMVLGAGIPAAAQGAATPLDGQIAGSGSTPDRNADVLPLPVASYAALVQMVDDVRNDMANWSPVEQSAYASAVKAAAPECLRLQMVAYDGSDLLALTRICALAQNWVSTYSAARRYTRTPAAEHRTDAFGLLLQADLHLLKHHEILEHLGELRGAGPVSAAQDEVFAYAIRSLQVTDPSYAVSAALLRQPDLLQCMTGCASDLSRVAAETAAWETATLVRESGVDKAEGAAAEIIAQAATRTEPLNAAQSAEVAMARVQFESLGRPMPADAMVPVACAGTVKGRKFEAPCARLYVVVKADAVTVPALMQAVEDLNGRLAPGEAATLLLSDCAVAPKLRAPHTARRRAPVLAELGASAGLLMVVTGPTDTVAWTAAASAAWLGPGGAAETLLSRVAQTAR